MALFDTGIGKLLSTLQFLRRLTESEELKKDALLHTTDAEYFKDAVKIGLEYDRYDGVEVLLVHLGVPEHLTLKEKIAYYQLLGE